jgi:putative addiction module component (TIGR02574 family)
MAMTLDQIVEETRQLPQDVRAELVERILLWAHGGIEPSVEAAWKLESQRRIAEIQTGKAKGVPLEEALAEARNIAGL